jgi:hypothetical protein
VLFTARRLHQVFDVRVTYAARTTTRRLSILLRRKSHPRARASIFGARQRQVPQVQHQGVSDVPAVSDVAGEQSGRGARVTTAEPVETTANAAVGRSVGASHLGPKAPNCFVPMSIQFWLLPVLSCH